MRKVLVVPSLMTIGNLVAGFLSLCFVLRGLSSPGEGHWSTAGWLIVLAMVLDSLDGVIARKTASTTRFGVELDSLADLVSFGVAPALLIVALIIEHSGFVPFRVTCAFSGLYLVCAGLRLARFNVESGNHRYFKGLPSPAAAMVVVALVLVNESVMEQTGSLIFVPLLPFSALLTGALMVSRVRYPHLSYLLLKKRNPFLFLVEGIFMAVPLVVFGEFAVLGFSLLYVAWGLLGAMKKPEKEITEEPAV